MRPLFFLLRHFSIPSGNLLLKSAFWLLMLSLISFTARAAPSPPGAPTFSSTTATSVSVKAPSIPSGATSLSLQRKLSSQNDSSYSTTNTGLSGSATTAVSGLASSTPYTFRYIGVGSTGSTNGTAASVTTLTPPGTPGAPTFSNVKSTTLTCTAPVKPANTSSLTLQRKLTSEADTLYITVKTGVAGSAATSVTGLSPSTAYTFRFLAVGTPSSNTTNGTAANVNTLAAPGVASAPVFSNLTSTSVTAKAPALPSNTDSLTLQSKLASEPEASYASIATGQTANSTRSVTGLLAGTFYSFRYLSVSGSAQTAGSVGSITTIPSAPAAPTFSNVTATSLIVTTPALPSGITAFTLQRKLAAAADSTYSNVATGVGGVANVTVTALNIGTGYSFRCLGVWSGGTSVGASANMTTLTEAPQTPELVSRSTTSIGLLLPLIPPGATSLALQRKLSSEAETSYVTVASGLAGGAITEVAGLSATTTYTFRCLAVNDGGQSPGSGVNFSTTQPLPALPGVPTFSGITPSQVVVTLPALPSGAASLTLQRKLASEGSEAFINVAAGLKGGSFNTIANLISTTTYTFRVAAVNDGGSSFGDGANVATVVTGASPGSPAAPAFADVSATTLKVKAPALPANTIQLKLQQKKSSEADSTYKEVIDGLLSQSETLVSDLSPVTNYTFRFIAIGQNNGGTLGTTATVTTTGALPYQPGVPQFGAVTGTSIQVYAPSLPVGATSLTLFKKLKSEPNGSFSVVASGVIGGASVSATGLSFDTQYAFYFAAVNSNGSTPGSPASMRTSPTTAVPDAPAQLVIISVSDDSVQFQRVPQPNADTTFTVQRKLASEPDWAYRDVQRANETYVPGLTPAIAYTFRLIARVSNIQTPGPATNVTTTGSLLSLAAPRFSNVTAQSVVVLAPPLPAGATSFTLQMSDGTISFDLFTGEGREFWDTAVDLAGESSTPVAGLSAASLYKFRFVAVFPSQSVIGTSASIYTPSSNVAAPSVPVLVAVFPDRVQIKNVSNREIYWKKSGQSDYQYRSSSSLRWTNQGLVAEIQDLTPNTSYQLRWRAANDDVFGPVLSVTTTSTTEPQPGLPPSPSFGATTSGSISVNIPVLPVYALYLELQYRKGSGGAFISDSDYETSSGAKEFFASATPYNFIPESGQNYAFRWVAVGAGGRTVGPETSVAIPAGPFAPGVPVVVGSTDISITFTLPPLPAGATSLRLQYSNISAATPTTVSINGSTTLAGGSTVTVTGLYPDAELKFRCVAVGDSQTVGEWINANTRPNANAPATPGVPIFSNVQSTQVTVTMPPLPAGAVSLTLQKKDGSDTSNFWSGDNYRTGLMADAVINITGLSPANSYRFRVVAVNAQGGTSGAVVSVITDLTLPGLPSFSDITSGSVKVTAPALPSGASVLTLHAKVSNQSDATYERVSDRLFGGEVTQINGLNRNTSYTFRYIAYSEYRTVLGPEASVTTLNASDTWSSGPPISCQGIAWPQNGATLARGSEGLLTAFLATDWDVRTSGATSNTLFSDTCSYLWTASAGQFKYGVASGQQVTWIAPNASGSYVLTLTVKDQNSANVGASEIGSRHLAAGASDAPLTFNLMVTVP